MAEGSDVAVELEQELDGGQREAAFHVWVGAELMHVPVESTRCVGVPILTMYVRKGNWNVSEMDSRTLLDYFFHFSSHVATLRCINRKKKKKKKFQGLGGKVWTLIGDPGWRAGRVALRVQSRHAEPACSCSCGAKLS